MVADEHNLYGFGAVSEMSGISRDGDLQPPTAEPGPGNNPAGGGITTVSAAGTEVASTTGEQETVVSPVTSGTPQSSLCPAGILFAAGIAFTVVRHRMK